MLFGGRVSAADVVAAKNAGYSLARLAGVLAGTTDPLTD